MRQCYIDPSSIAYYEDQLFNAQNAILNREDTLAPFIRLREALSKQDIELHTADYLIGSGDTNYNNDYYSLGVLKNYQSLASNGQARLRAFVIFEPPVVDPRLYQELPQLTAAFERVYVHNVVGDGYSLAGVDCTKLRKLFWPQPRNEVIEQIWLRQGRQRRIVVINGNHKPASFQNELYSKRIEAMVELSQSGAVDLFGRGWERWWSRASMWKPYWYNRRTIMSIYKGGCASKYEVLGNYAFALCFENMSMQGYITEKIFDCFYAGTIPLYLGAKDIDQLIPQSAYFDCRKFQSWSELWGALSALTDQQITSMRDAGREFIHGEQGAKYFNSLLDIFNEG